MSRRSPTKLRCSAEGRLTTVHTNAIFCQQQSSRPEADPGEVAFSSQRLLLMILLLTAREADHRWRAWSHLGTSVKYYARGQITIEKQCNQTSSWSSLPFFIVMRADRRLSTSEVSSESFSCASKILGRTRHQTSPDDQCQTYNLPLSSDLNQCFWEGEDHRYPRKTLVPTKSSSFSANLPCYRSGKHQARMGDACGLARGSLGSTRI